MMKMPFLVFPVKRQSLVALVACLSFASAAFAGVEQTVNDLIPKLAAEKVEDRYAAQMELQGIALNAARPDAEAERAEVAKILAAKATDAAVPQPARIWMVRQLEYTGSAESVTARTALLAGQDAELKECARRALEKNPDPGATVSLHTALEKGGETPWRIGLIQSLGERGDAKSTALIAPCLKSKETALAAASALGKIATDDAVTALWGAYVEGVPGAADGLVTAGNRHLLAGRKAAAKGLFERIYMTGAKAPSSRSTPAVKSPPAPVQVRSAALIGRAAADPKSALPFIISALEGGSPGLYSAAVIATTVAYGKPGASAVLAPLMGRLSPDAKRCVLRTLDTAAEKRIIAAASDPDAAVQSDAIERLGQVGTAASIPLLFQIATNGGANSKTAAAALARVSGPGTDIAISRLAGEGDAKSRTIAIQALAQRNNASASPALLKYAGEADPEVSRAACAALAKLGTDSQLDGLIQLVLAGKTPGAAAALQAVANRTADRSAAAQKLIAQTQSAEPRQLAPLFEVLALLGGNEALAAVSSFAGNSTPEAKDAAIRTLANWPDFSAHKALLVIVSDPNTQRTHSVLAIQAIARLVQSSEKEPATNRLEAAQAAMKAAGRDEEKKLLLSAFASVPDAKAAEAIKPFLNNPGLKNEAGLAAMALAESLPKGNRALARSLAQAVKEAGVAAEITQRADALLNKR